MCVLGGDLLPVDLKVHGHSSKLSDSASPGGQALVESRINGSPHSADTIQLPLVRD